MMIKNSTQQMLKLNYKSTCKPYPSKARSVQQLLDPGARNVSEQILQRIPMKFCR